MKINLLPFCIISVFSKQIESIITGGWEVYQSSLNASYYFTIKPIEKTSNYQLQFINQPLCCLSSYLLSFTNTTIKVMTENEVFLSLEYEEIEGMITTHSTITLCDEEYSFILSMFHDMTMIIAISYDLKSNNNDFDDESILFDNDFILARKIEITLIEESFLERYFVFFLSVLLISLFHLFISYLFIDYNYLY